MKIPPSILAFRRCAAVMAVITSLFVSGCATTAVRPTQYPSSAKDWNGIDSVEFLKEFRLQNYSRLVVEPLDTSATQLPPKDENTYQPVMGVLKKTDSILLTEIAQKLKGQVEVTDQKPDAASMNQTILLRGKVADIHPGSQAARYWAGFGAGSAWVKINGEIVDAKSNDVLLRFEQQRVGAMGMFGGSYNGLLTDCVVEIGRDIGRMITLFKAP